MFPPAPVTSLATTHTQRIPQNSNFSDTLKTFRDETCWHGRESEIGLLNFALKIHRALDLRNCKYDSEKFPSSRATELRWHFGLPRGSSKPCKRTQQEHLRYHKHSSVSGITSGGSENRHLLNSRSNSASCWDLAKWKRPTGTCNAQEKHSAAVFLSKKGS